MAGGGASIADLFFRAFMEDKDLQLQAQKAGDKAGQTMGSRMSKGIGTALRVGLGVASGGLALATKGLLELDDTMAQFTADTGLAGAEADKARASILAMSGRNLQPMREIGAVLSKVHTDLGLTGDAADETAEKFLHLARVTGRDASEEVAAFDDILDAWGLTADHSGEIMDKLIASHQKYGGSISDNEDALAKMAPQLKALNLGLDDGVGLLNLFAASGLDASAGQKALNAAITKLPPGTSLQEFITHLSTVVDDGQRAREAMEVFGTKAGAGLANAIRPGIDSLDDFKISTQDATGATEKARDAIDGTFGNKIKLLIKGAAAEVTKFGGAFGPALTGLASLSTLAGALGGGRLASALAKGLAGAWKAAAATAILGGAIERAGSLAATGYLKLLLAGDAISTVLSKAWVAATGTSTAAAAAAGRAAGLAFAGAFAIAVPVLLLATDALDKFHKATDTGVTDLDRLKQAGTGRLFPFIGPEISLLGDTVRDFGPNMADAMREAKGGVTAAAKEMVAGIPEAGKEAQADAVVIAAATPFEIAKSLREGADPVKMAAELLKDAIENALLPAKEIAQLQGILTGKELAAGLRDKRPEVQAAAQAYKASIEERLLALRNGVPQIAVDTGQTYADALTSTSGQIAEAARAVAARAGAEFRALRADASGYGTDTGNAYGSALAKSLKAKQQAVLAALRGYRTAMAAGSPPKPGAVLYGIDKWGASTGDAFVDPLIARLKAGVAQARQQLSGFGMPAGPQFAMAGAGALSGGTVPSMGAGFAGDTITSGDTHVNVQLPGLLRAETPTDVVRTLRHLNVYGTFRK